MRKLIYLAAVVILLLLSSIPVSMYMSQDPLKEFSGASYIPQGYQVGGNNTTKNSTFILYQNGTDMNLFVVGATVDPDKKFYKSIKSSFSKNTTQSANLILVKENLVVDGHPIELHREEINVNGTLIDFFETKWYCDKSKLTITATGIVPATEMEEMRKMLKSIKCHKDSFF